MARLGSYEEKEDKVAEKVAKTVGSNPVTSKVEENIKNRKNRIEKSGVFEAVYKLLRAAEDLYVEDDMAFDKVVASLSAAIAKLKGKEGEFKKEAEKEEKTEATPA